MIDGADPRGELAFAQALAGRGGHGPLDPVSGIARSKPTGKPIADKTRPKDDHVFVAGDPPRHVFDESGELFMALSIKCALGRASASVTDLRSVTEMTRRAMVRRDI